MPGAARLLVALSVSALALSATLGAGLLGALAQPTAGAPAAVDGIPREYLDAYTASAARFALGADGWSYLAAIGKVESDHGRSTAPGVHSGQNSHGCCAGPMQIHNGFGSGGATWGAFKVDGDGDGRADIYDVDDAVATAARYLQASGAPDDWRRALFAYNHADWYVEQVARQATEYRTGASGGWLADVPGAPGQRCDARIVADVVMLTARFGVRLTACYAEHGHASRGEHPLGLAADLVPANGDWSRTLALARAYGWSPSCANSGCPERGPFRVILYNGFPGHGDPSHTDRPHLHLSWQHAPAAPMTPARWVRVLLAPAGLR